MSTAAPPVRLFFCHAHEDEDLCGRLEAHLSLLERTGVIEVRHKRLIAAGQRWDSAIREEIRLADIILLLISASFLQSDDCYDVEMSLSLGRHERGEALVIPIILRPVDWEGASFGALPCLPSNALAATMWRDVDEAFLDIARGVRRAIDARAKGEPFTLTESSPDAASQERALDAAVPSEVTVGERTEVLALIATASSGGLRAVLEVEPQSFSVTPEDVRTSRFELSFPVDAQGHPKATTVTVALESRHFDPPQTCKKILVRPNVDSTVCTLFVTPKRTGVLSLLLELRMEDVTIWSQRLRTTGTDSAVRASRGYLVTSVPLYTVSRPPEERTVMKQAAELLRQALAEAGASIDEIGSSTVKDAMKAAPAKEPEAPAPAKEPEQPAPAKEEPALAKEEKPAAPEPAAAKEEKPVEAVAAAEPVAEAKVESEKPPASRPKAREVERAKAAPKSDKPKSAPVERLEPAKPMLLQREESGGSGRVLSCFVLLIVLGCIVVLVWSRC